MASGKITIGSLTVMIDATEPARELPPSRDRLLAEIARSLRAESPHHAEVLLRELELLLVPPPAAKMRRHRLQCACGEAILCRPGASPLPARGDGPGALAEARRTLPLTHADRWEELWRELTRMASAPATAAAGGFTAVCPWCRTTGPVASELDCPACGLG